MRKVLAVVIILALLILQIPAAVFADSQGVDNVLNQVKTLKETNPAGMAAILGKIWEYAALENTDGQDVQVSTVYSNVKASVGSSLWGSVVNEGNTAVVGKLEKSSVEMIIQKVIDKKDILSA